MACWTCVDLLACMLSLFTRIVLQSINYDSVDWDDMWDETEERDSEERWFDEEEEAEAPLMDVDT